MKNELEKLKLKELEYNFIKDFSCATKEEFEIFFNENKSAFEELQSLREKIRSLEMTLLSVKEKQEKVDYLKELKKKFPPSNT